MMLTTQRSVWPQLVLSLALTTSCGKSDDGNDRGDADAEKIDLLDTSAAGKIGGSAWEFKGGYADAPYDDDGTQLTVALLSTSLENPCDVFARKYSDSYTIFRVGVTAPEQIKFPTEKKEYIALFHGANTNSMSGVAATGIAVVDKITSDTVSGKILAQFDSSNTINGTFNVKRCPKRTL